MKEQITENFAYLLLDNTSVYNLIETWAKREIIKEWKEKGYIKQSREEEIRENIKNIECSKPYQNYSGHILNYITQLKELIEMLDNKDKIYEK